MLTTKTSFYLAGMFAPFFQPLLAEATSLMDPWGIPEQFGICGIFAVLHWWTIAKTIPSMSDDHRAGMTEIGDEIRLLRGDINQNMQEQLICLRSDKSDKKQP